MTFDLELYRRQLRERRRAMPRYCVLRRSPKKSWLVYLYDVPGAAVFQCFRFSSWAEAMAWMGMVAC